MEWFDDLCRRIYAWLYVRQPDEAELRAMIEQIKARKAGQ